MVSVIGWSPRASINVFPVYLGAGHLSNTRSIEDHGPSTWMSSLCVVGTARIGLLRCDIRSQPTALPPIEYAVIACVISKGGC